MALARTTVVFHLYRLASERGKCGECDPPRPRRRCRAFQSRKRRFRRSSTICTIAICLHLPFLLQNSSKRYIYRFNGYNQLLDQEGRPGVKPPGERNAINLNTGRIVWKVPLGEYQEFDAGHPENRNNEFLAERTTTAGAWFFAAAHAI